MFTQQGFALLELAVAVLIATLLAALAADRFAERNKELTAQAHAVWMSGVRQATLRYLEQYGETLHAEGEHAIIGGFGNPMAPTLTELKDAGFLAQGYPMDAARGVGARVSLIRSANCPHEPCRLDTLIYSDLPLSSNTTHAEPALTAYWLAASQGKGGAVISGRSHIVAGPSFSFTNPPALDMAPLAVGTVAMAVTTEQLNSLIYLKVRDTRDPNFQGSASIAGHVSAGGVLSTAEHLHIQSQADAHTACDVEAAVVGERYGGLLVCRSGRWVSAGGPGGGGYSINSVSGCMGVARNPVTGDCACPTDYMAVLISDSTSPNPAQGRTRGYLCVQ